MKEAGAAYIALKRAFALSANAVRAKLLQAGTATSTFLARTVQPQLALVRKAMLAKSLRPIDGFAIAFNAVVFALVIFCAVPPRLNKHPLGSAPPVVEAPAIVAPEPATPAPGPAATPGQIGEAFVERFGGEDIDEERWRVSDGWNNGEWIDNDWRASQVRMTDNGARITLQKAEPGSSKPLASGEFRTNAFFRYGYFEFRLRIPRGSGVFSGAFTYAHTDGATKPNEIDIEIIGRNTRRVELTYHVGGKATSKKVALPFDAAEGFHTFAFDWQPDSIAWYADGKLLHEARGGGVGRLTRPQNIFLSQLASTQLSEWVGPLDHDAGPWAFDIACVAYAPTKPDRPLCD